MKAHPITKALLAAWQEATGQTAELAAMRADTAYGAEARMIDAQAHLTDCQKRARLAKLAERWRAWQNGNGKAKGQ
jgi:hypothetical protein